MFSEKLNFLIDLTDTRNSTLAMIANVDASYISRMRRGKRALPEKQSFVLPMARYFARNLGDEFKRKVLVGALHLGELPQDPELLAKLLHDWLIERKNGSVGAENFVSAFVRTAAVKPLTKDVSVSIPLGYEKLCYYGNKGKREAVIRFLAAVHATEERQTLLLFSDENMGWMTEDAAFSLKWRELLAAVLKKGNRIKVIHTINRDVDEMMQAVAKWVPIYMTGMIEPFFYPKLRDAVFQRTLFVAPKTAAMVSNSVARSSDGMLNLFIDHPDAVAALVKEFERYLSLCRPLMGTFEPVNSESFFTNLCSFAQSAAPSVCLAPCPSLMTMPEDVASSISLRSGSSRFYQLWKDLSISLEHNFTAPFTEVITGGGQAEERIYLPMPDFFRTEKLYYTQEEYARHISHIDTLKEKHGNYNYILAKQAEFPVIMWGKEDVGILFARPALPSRVFVFDERNMTAAFWEYLKKEVLLAAR